MKKVLEWNDFCSKFKETEFEKALFQSDFGLSHNTFFYIKRFSTNGFFQLHLETPMLRFLYTL